tara:strand:+ start:490 stop:2469 length:1980 start_codon:yes stop_codon:yes gene_type:complete
MAENLKISLKLDTPEVKVQANVPTIIDGNINSQPKINFVSVGQRGSVGPAGPAGTITAEQQAAINANTAKVGITTEQANAIAVNTSKVGITTEQADAISANTSKVSITPSQASAIVANTAKNSYPDADSTKLAGIQAGAEVNVQANWNETDSNADSFIQNKPTIPTDTNTTYTVSCVDGDNSDEEKIRLTDSNGANDDIVLEAGTGLSIARSGDKITFTNTVTDTDTVLTTEQVQDIVGAMFTSNTETRISATYQDDDGTIDLVVDDMTADTNTQLTAEEVQDIVGAMVSGNTETNISVTYDDTSGKLNFASTDTNTTYSEATSSSEGLMSTAHHDKLDGIETGADVTDAVNVTAAGALMDSELTDLAGIKSLDTSTIVTLNDTQSISGAKSFGRKVTLDTNKNVTPSGDGVTLHVDAQDITDTNTAASGTTSFFNHVVVENPRLMATNSSVTTTTANTVYIKGAPVASTNQTITNTYAFYVAAGGSYFGGDLNVTGIITGKQREIYSQSFVDDLGTTKHYIPWKDINEQTTVYQEEAAMVVPCDGRVVSVTVRTASVTGSANMTIGINTIAPNINSFASSSWTEEETETLAINSADDYHVFHFAFDNAKHFDSGDLLSLSIQNDADISSNTFWYVTTVVEYDWNTFLGTTSAEHDSNP